MSLEKWVKMRAEVAAAMINNANINTHSQKNNNS
jgi:hypothetical protein